MKKSKGQECKDRILEVALKTFMKKGFQGTSLSTVARLANVTKGGIYHYFSSKEDLYKQSLMIYFTDRKYAYWLDGLKDLPVKEFIKQWFECVKNNKKNIQRLVGSNKDDAILYLYTFLYEATRKYPEFQRSLDEYDDSKMRIVSEVFKKAQKKGDIRKDIDPELLAFELDNYLQQLQYMKFVNPKMKEDDEMMDKLFDNYWIRLKK